MADSFTTRLGLTIFDPDIAYDIEKHNTNSNLIDADLGGAVICTAATNPSSGNYDGRLIYETDSGAIKVRNSGAFHAPSGKYFICTSGTRPTATFGGMGIYETDTGNRLVRNAANTDWIPLSPYRVADSSALAALTGVPNGFLAIVNSTNEFYMRYFTLWGYVVMPAAHNRGVPGFGSTSSTSYTATLAGGSVVGVSFTAPIGGRVEVSTDMYMWNGGANACYCSFRICTGAVVGSGTQVLAPDDSFAAIMNGTNAATFSRTAVVTGLTSGSVYNVQQRVRVAAGTGNFNYCGITVNGA